MDIEQNLVLNSHKRQTDHRPEEETVMGYIGHGAKSEEEIYVELSVG